MLTGPFRTRLFELFSKCKIKKTTRLDSRDYSAQAELISQFSLKELEVSDDGFERFVKLWEQEHKKMRSDQ